ncbi:MAG: sporulation protein [candidate division Zixibacteria bacterium]|nr:sporulation protein [candidate division Zixibacteria bacterium]
MTNNVVEILKGVVGELKEMARSEAIIGKPITIGDRTVIPVVKISVGFGAGGGQGEAEKTGTGFGGGGGGGAKIEPSAFIIIDKDGFKVLPAKKGSWEGLIDTIPDLAKKVSKLKDKFASDKGEGKSGGSKASNDTSAESSSDTEPPADY